jgi:hypothetical protein
MQSVLATFYDYMYIVRDRYSCHIEDVARRVRGHRITLLPRPEWPLSNLLVAVDGFKILASILINAPTCSGLLKYTAQWAAAHIVCIGHIIRLQLHVILVNNKRFKAPAAVVIVIQVFHHVRHMFLWTTNSVSTRRSESATAATNRPASLRPAPTKMRQLVSRILDSAHAIRYCKNSNSDASASGTFFGRLFTG